MLIYLYYTCIYIKARFISKFYLFLSCFYFLKVDILKKFIFTGKLLTAQDT